jgi:hypothetical protein
MVFGGPLDPFGELLVQWHNHLGPDVLVVAKRHSSLLHHAKSGKLQ